MKQFAIALVLVFSSVGGFSQCLANRVSAHKEMRAASSVIMGTVTAAKPVPETWDFLDGVNYTVRVDSVIHGKTPHSGEYTVFSENSPRVFEMSVGKHYVLYVQQEYDRYKVDNCGNSHQTEELEASAKQSKQMAKGY